MSKIMIVINFICALFAAAMLDVQNEDVINIGWGLALLINGGVVLNELLKSEGKL